MLHRSPDRHWTAVTRAGGLLALVTFICGWPAVPAAQTSRVPPSQTRPRLALRVPAPPPGPRVHLFFLADATTMTAAESFNAVAGTSRAMAFGGGVDVLRIWKGLFARAAVSVARLNGERVSVFGTDSQSVGIPLKIRMTPLDLTMGWRYTVGRRRRVAVYAAGGAVRLRYQETSQFARPGEDTDEWFNGYSVCAGLDAAIGRWFFVAGEGELRSVPNAIGAAGASAAFGDTDLGGTTVRVLIGIKH
jgi:hypothetical protein